MKQCCQGAEELGTKPTWPTGGFLVLAASPGLHTHIAGAPQKGDCRIRNGVGSLPICEITQSNQEIAMPVPD